jgi:hypothetical protein
VRLFLLLLFWHDGGRRRHGGSGWLLLAMVDISFVVAGQIHGMEGRRGTPTIGECWIVKRPGRAGSPAWTTHSSSFMAGRERPSMTVTVTAEQPSRGDGFLAFVVVVVFVVRVIVVALAWYVVAYGTPNGMCFLQRRGHRTIYPCIIPSILPYQFGGCSFRKTMNSAFVA